MSVFRTSTSRADTGRHTNPTREPAMSESATPPVTPPPGPVTDPVTPPVTPTEGDTPEDPAALADKWKAIARQHEARAKANASAAKRLEDIEAAAKSDLEKANDRATKAEQRAAALEISAARSQVAATYGVPPELVTGDDEAAMVAAARAAIAWRDEAASTPRRKVIDPAALTSGAADRTAGPSTGKARAAAALRGIGGTA